jgi:hypothetical protein
MKSIMMTTTAIAMFGAAWVLLPARGHEAAAQSGPLYISAVDVDIVPGELEKYIAAIMENGAAFCEGIGLSRIQHYGFSNGSESRARVRGL